MDSKEKAIEIVKRYAGALQQRKVPVKLLILFGSQARGTAGPDSDLDVLVVVEGWMKRSERSSLMRRLSLVYRKAKT